MLHRSIHTFRRVATGLRLSLGLLAVAVAYAAVVSPLKAQSPAPSWPPALDQAYPDLNLMDQSGKRVRLSAFKGKIIVVEPIGMTCPACQAFSGANGPRGPLPGFQPQKDLKSFEEYLKEYAGVSLSSNQLVFVQLVLYNQNMQAPSLADIQTWARHFGMDNAANKMVLAASPDMLGSYSFNMIPGFQLIDQNFVLRSDSTGHNPRNDLWQHFFPTLKKLVKS